MPVRARAGRGGLPAAAAPDGPARAARRAVRRDAGRAQAQVHPSPALEGARGRRARRARLRFGPHLLRRAAHADRHLGWIPDDGDLLRVPPAPRHVVLGAAVADQLVAPHVRVRARQRHGLPPAVLLERRQEQLAQLQLLRLEQAEPRRRRQTHRRRHARAAQARGARRPGGRPAPRVPRGRRHRFFGRAAPLDGARNVDSSCTGTSMRDFLSCRDLHPIDEQIAAQYDAGPLPPNAVLVYRPPGAP